MDKDTNDSKIDATARGGGEWDKIGFMRFRKMWDIRMNRYAEKKVSQEGKKFQESTEQRAELTAYS